MSLWQISVSSLRNTPTVFRRTHWSTTIARGSPPLYSIFSLDNRRDDDNWVGFMDLHEEFLRLKELLQITEYGAKTGIDDYSKIPKFCTLIHPNREDVEVIHVLCISR